MVLLVQMLQTESQQPALMWTTMELKPTPLANAMVMAHLMQ
jgi:hypothetical protein